VGMAENDEDQLDRKEIKQGNANKHGAGTKINDKNKKN